MNELVKTNLYLAHADSDELYHYGVLGMHWGVRRYQPYSRGYQGETRGKTVGEASKIKSNNRANKKTGESSKEVDPAKKKRIKKAVVIGAVAVTALVGAAALSHKVNSIRTDGLRHQLNEALSRNAADRVKLADARDTVDKLYTRGRIEGWADDETQKLFDQAIEIRNHYGKVAEESGRRAAVLQDKLDVKKGKRLKENIKFVSGKISKKSKGTGSRVTRDISEVERRFSEAMKKQKLASKNSLISLYREAQSGNQDAMSLLRSELTRRRNSGLTDIDMTTLAGLARRR